MKADIIALMGNKGAGKDTIANMIKKNATQYDEVIIMSFADSLKDATSAIFGFDRQMLEGGTVESRNWREKEIPELSEKMGVKVTPRFLLQRIGTNILRKYLYDGIWVDSVLAKIKNTIEEDNTKSYLFIITDCRFKNEIKVLAKVCPGTKFVEVDRRFRSTKMYAYAYKYNNTHNPFVKAYCWFMLKKEHRSDWDWVGVVKNPILIYNIGSLDNLESLVNSVIL